MTLIKKIWKKQPKMEPTVSLKNFKVEIKWNRKIEQTLYDEYRKDSRSIQISHIKSAWESKKEASKTYIFQANT